MNSATHRTEDHGELLELLPWYTNSSLDVADRRRVEEHLDQCASCRGELDFLNALAASVGEEEPLLSSAERSFAKLRDRIDAVEAARGGRLQWRDVARILTAKVSGIFGAPGARWRVVGATAALLVAVAATWLWIEASSPDFRTLSRTGEIQATEGPTVRLVLEPTASVSEVEALLRGVGAEVVSGPSEYGVYTLRLAVSTEEALELAVEELRTSPLVRFAEPLPGPFGTDQRP